MNRKKGGNRIQHLLYVVLYIMGVSYFINPKWLAVILILPPALFLLCSLGSLLVLGILSFLTAFLVGPKLRKATRPILLPALLSKEQQTTYLAQTEESHQWAQSNGFVFIDYFQSPNYRVTIAAWQHQNQPTYFVQILGKKSRNITTLFNHDILLSSNLSSTGFFHPGPPGLYFQAFQQISLDELWSRHREMETYLKEIGQAQWCSFAWDFVTVYCDTIEKEIKFIRDLRFGPFQLGYRQFQYWQAINNRSLKDQHEAGVIRLPNELSA